MKIRTKLQIAAIFSITVALMIGLILFFSAQQVNEAIKKKMAADEIIRGMFELNILTNSYLLHHEERAKTQWQLKHDSLKRVLEEVEVKSPENIVLLKRIREGHKNIKNIFSQMVSNYEGHGDEKESVSQELNEILMGNLDTKSRSMVFDVYQLAEISSARLVTSQQRAHLLVLLFSLIMAAAVATVSFSIHSGVVKPIGKLHEGTEVIGAGNLNYKVGTMAKDEVGQLSRAFDQMTIQLKESFGGLEKEAAERRRAEEHIRKLNRVYAVLSDTNQAIVRIRDLQALFEKACGIAVETGGFLMAWVGLMDESTQSIQVVAHVGGTDSYFEKLDISMSGKPLSYCPVDCALRERRHAICNVIPNNAHIAPCQEIAYQLGSRSSASFPLIVSGKIRGTINLYSGEPNFFDEEELKLLDELAMDISFAMEFTQKEAERKHAEKALRDSEDRYRDLVEHSQDLIYTHDLQGQFLSVNPAVANLLGQDRSTLLNMNVRSILVPEVSDQFSSYLDTISRDGAAKGLMLVQTTAGERRILEYNNTLRTEGVASPVVRGVCHDVTELKRAEQALRESEERYRVLVETSPDAITLVGLNLNVIAVNRPALTLYGYERKEEVIGKSVLDYLVPEELARAREDIGRVLETGEIGTVEYTLLKKDGTVFPAELKASLILDKGKKPSGILLVSRDITERKQAEKAFRESEKRYRTLAESAEDVIFILDPEGHFQYMNQFGAIQLGSDPGKIIGKRSSQLFPPEVAEKQMLGLKTVLESRKPFFQEINMALSTGEIYSDVRLVPVLAQSGEVQSVMGIARDITEHKRAEEALRESEERFRELYDYAPVGYHEYDSDGRITRVNRTDLEMLGYTAEEMIGQPIWKLNVEDEIARRQVLEKLAGSRPPGQNLERTYKRKDGTTLPVLIEDRLIQDENGRIRGIRCTVQDITDRKRGEESLKQSEENARQLAQENATMAEIGRIISSTLNIDEIYQSFSEEVRKIISFDRIVINFIDTEKNTLKNVYMAGKELQDRNVRDVYPLEGSGNAEMVRTRSTFLIQTEDFSEYKDRFPMLLSTFQAGFRSIMNVPLFSKGEVIGGLLLRSYKPYAYTDKDVKLAERIGSQIAGAIANAQLYTERIQGEKEREALQEQLRQSQKMEAIGRLAGGVAHDFNNLLTVIKGYSQLSLAETKEDNPLRENIEEIRKAADRAGDLTRQLLAFSRRQIMEMKVLDLNDILRNLDKMLHRVIGEDIELLFQLTEGIGRVKADPGQIEQVVMNLVVNSRDAISSGGKLTIETANVILDEEYADSHVAVKPGPYVMLSVSDTGVGMTPGVRERVFEPFFTTKGRGKGTGLGLSTVYGIVKQSGGNIWVYSEPGKGTTFKIYLPRVDEPLGELKGEVMKEELPQGSETILIVEDDEDVRKLASKVLEKQGYRVLIASQGSDALSLCGAYKKPIHMVLCDVVMPGMAGRELTEHLVSFHSEMKVLYMSGYTENAIVHHGILIEGMNYIQKPFTVEGLVRKVKEALDKV
jgi:two-component system cell cycle sensor histidine kinase/response regulator CckA